MSCQWLRWCSPIGEKGCVIYFGPKLRVLGLRFADPQAKPTHTHTHIYIYTYISYSALLKQRPVAARVGPTYVQQNWKIPPVFGICLLSKTIAEIPGCVWPETPQAPEETPHPLWDHQINWQKRFDNEVRWILKIYKGRRREISRSLGVVFSALWLTTRY